MLELSSMNIAGLGEKTKEQLLELGRSLGLTGLAPLKKEEIVLRILRASAEQQGYAFRKGILEIVDEGYAFLRQKHLHLASDDVYVSQSQVRRLSLRNGDVVAGQTRPPKDSEKYYSLLRVEAVNGLDPEEAKRRTYFDNLTPVFPNKLITGDVPDDDPEVEIRIEVW